jgi:hypothetical protein
MQPNLQSTPMADRISLEFIETQVFTRQVTSLMSDEEYRELQTLLLENPEAGNIIKGGGGIRKVRFGLQGQGKSGGVRTIYFWKKSADQIYMLLMFPKSMKETLTDAETEVLRVYVKGL